MKKWIKPCTTVYNQTHKPKPWIITQLRFTKLKKMLKCLQKINKKNNDVLKQTVKGFAVVIETSQASVYSQDMIRTLFK